MLGPQHLLPGDLVDVLDHGPPDKPFDAPAQYRWHAVDAKHAVSVEPDRYTLVEHRVSITPHSPGYSAVTPEMIIGGFNAPLREQRQSIDHGFDDRPDPPAQGVAPVDPPAEIVEDDSRKGSG